MQLDIVLANDSNVNPFQRGCSASIVGLSFDEDYKLVDYPNHLSIHFLDIILITSRNFVMRVLGCV